MRLDLPHDSLVATVKDDSLQFEPGSHFYYNNTGYFLLGMVVEKVTGKSYGDYLKDVLFAPNGLTSTMYCGTSQLIKHRARGYDVPPTGMVNTDYISMDLPFAAGSLCSSVGDLVAWTRLLHSGQAGEPVVVREHDDAREAHQRTTHAVRLRTLLWTHSAPIAGFITAAASMGSSPSWRIIRMTH